jgi:phage terminase large subunit-like protein
MYRFIEYAEKVITKEIMTGRYLYKAVERFVRDLESQEDENFPYYFDTGEAQKIIDFVRFTGIIEPLPFQEWIYSQIYGWRHKAEPSLRRFQEAFISMAKKNGKTLFISPLLLHDLYFTDKAEAYVISTNSEISNRSYENIRNIIDEIPEFSNTLRITRSEITNSQNRGRLKFFSSDKNKNGLGASLLVADEGAFFEDYVLFDRLRTGMKARRNKLIITISTNGENKNLPYYEEYEKNRKVLDGVYEDDRIFIAIYELDEGDKLEDQSNWVKCNPALDNDELNIQDKLTHDSLEYDLKQAEMVPSKKQRILLYNFNLWSEHSKTWINGDIWNKSRGQLPRETLRDLRCCGGLDISEVSDLTTFSLYFEPVEGRFPTLHKAYISEASLEQRELHESTQYRKWIEEGWITLCKGNTINHKQVAQDIIDLSVEFKLLEIGIDPNYKAQEYIRILEDDNDLTLIEVRQGIAYFSPFTKEWERDLLEGKIIDENPVMAYCLGNAEIRPDVNNNYKPLKRNNQYKNKIDMVITAIMAHSRMKANLNKKVETFHSVWDLAE